MDFDQRKFSAWLRRHGRARSTAEAYCTSVRLYCEQGYRWTFEDACRWKEEEMSRVKPATVNIRIHAVNAFAEYSRVRWRLKPVKLQNQQFVENQLSVSQYERLLQCLLDDGNLRWWAAIKILACTGVRISEFLQIKREDLKVGYVDVCGKGTKYRRVWFGSKLRQEVLSIYKEDGPILPYNQGVIRKRLHAFARKYKLPKEPLHPHEFRAFYARRVYEKCHDLKFLQDLLGHADIKTTVRYLRKTSKGISRRISKIVTWWGISGEIGVSGSLSGSGSGAYSFRTKYVAAGGLQGSMNGFWVENGVGSRYYTLASDRMIPTSGEIEPISMVIYSLLRIAWGIRGQIGNNEPWSNRGFAGYGWNTARGAFPELIIGDMAIKLEPGEEYLSLTAIRFDSSAVAPISLESKPAAISVCSLIRIAWGISGRHQTVSYKDYTNRNYGALKIVTENYNSTCPEGGGYYGVWVHLDSSMVIPEADEATPVASSMSCLLRILWADSLWQLRRV